MELEGKERGWHAVPREQAPSAGQRSRLRALGYVDDEAAAQTRLRSGEELLRSGVGVDDPSLRIGHHHGIGQRLPLL